MEECRTPCQQELPELWRMRRRKRSYRRRRRRKSKKRVYAAMKGWDTRTRNEGIWQITRTITGAISPVRKIRFVKNLVVGTLKITCPRTSRKSKLLRKIDKIL